MKCPSSYREGYDFLNQKASYIYIYSKEDGTVSLKSNHLYFYQVQTQMLVSGFQFCEFFVWTKRDSLRINIDIDEDIQAEINNTKNLFCKVLLLERTGKYFTKLKLNGDETEGLIMCEWFNLKCMRIKKYLNREYYILLNREKKPKIL